MWQMKISSLGFAGSSYNKNRSEWTVSQSFSSSLSLLLNLSKTMLSSMFLFSFK